MSSHCPGQEKRSEVLDRALTAVLSGTDIHSVADRTASLLRELFGETRLSIHLCAEDSPGTAEVLLADPAGGGAPAGTRVALEGSAVGMAVGQGRLFVLEGLNASRPRLREERALAEARYGTLACFPLVFEGRVLGTLDIAHPPREGLLDCCLETATRVARLLAIALHNSLMVEEVRRLNRLLDRENVLLKEQIRQERGDLRYIAESPAMRAVLDKVRLVAPSESTVLIRGETGTGKEGLARLVHEFSPRFGNPLVVVNLGALPESLIESELFGYEKGAFTGALQRREGRFERAEGGTIFLDEVGDAPSAVQVRLLRVLQEKEILRVGGRESLKVDVRVVAATNRPLEEMVSAGTFRADLYYRLNIFPIFLPPLRQRREDIRLLGSYFLTRQSTRMHRRVPEVPETVWQTLEERGWPGNVRELENLLERALILSPGAELVLPEPESVARDGAGAPPPSAEAAGGDDLPGRPLTAAEGGADPPVPNYEEAVRDLLRRALHSTGGRIYGPAGAAALLGLKPTTLQGKLRRYGIGESRSRD
jgi:formate hydrogenlyase transcriptional activator